MTGERLCVRCGHNRNWNGACGYPVHEMFGHDISHHHFEEAAPSTDEGEARDWVRAEESPDFVVWRLYEGGFCTGAATLPKEAEAAIRAPLEERIRELERGGALFQEVIAALQYDHDQAIEASDTRIRELEAGSERILERAREHKHQAEDAFGKISDFEREVERLREALRDTATNLNMASLVVDTALLPSPLSSTEGTE